MRARSLLARALVHAPQVVAPGLWVVRGGLPRHGMNVFLLSEGDGVVCFDTGSREMATELQRVAIALGGISRILLSHSHADHRGAARGIGAPVWCHEDERRDVEGDAGRGYWTLGAAGVRRDWLRGRVMSALRDGGSVPVAGTVVQGDRVGEFIVIHLPGHAPGQIGLWRESDRTVLVGDCFHAVDDHTAALPQVAFSHDMALARASVLRVAAMEPVLALSGHGPALRGNVQKMLERAV